LIIPEFVCIIAIYIIIKLTQNDGNIPPEYKRKVVHAYMTDKSTVNTDKKELDLRTMLILRNMKPRGWYDSVYFYKKNSSNKNK